MNQWSRFLQNKGEKNLTNWKSKILLLNFLLTGVIVIYCNFRSNWENDSRYWNTPYPCWLPFVDAKFQNLGLLMTCFFCPRGTNSVTLISKFSNLKPTYQRMASPSHRALMGSVIAEGYVRLEGAAVMQRPPRFLHGTAFTQKSSARLSRA